MDGCIQQQRLKLERTYPGESPDVYYHQQSENENKTETEIENENKNDTLSHISRFFTVLCDLLALPSSFQTRLNSTGLDWTCIYLLDSNAMLVQHEKPVKKFTSLYQMCSSCTLQKDMITLSRKDIHLFVEADRSLVFLIKTSHIFFALSILFWRL